MGVPIDLLPGITVQATFLPVERIPPSDSKLISDDDKGGGGETKKKLDAAIIAAIVLYRILNNSRFCLISSGRKEGEKLEVMPVRGLAFSATFPAKLSAAPDLYYVKRIVF